nr:reductive dehalogenase [uncultured bacterium]
MSKFHSTVSRREFIKGLGITGLSLGAATALAPTFHDMDEVLSSSNADPQYRPWYIKERDYENPTTEIDWGLSHRADRTKQFDAATNDRSTIPSIKETRAIFPERQYEWLKEQHPVWQGNTVRDFALHNAGSSLAFYDFHSYGGYRGYNASSHKSSSFTGLEVAALPEENGFSKWNGTPEENLRMIRAACRVFGCEEVGVVEVTANTRKLINLNSSSGKPINFKNVDKAEESDGEYVIPEKCKYMIVYTNLQPTYLTQRCPSETGLTANTMSYTRMPIQRVELQEFLRGLGYQGLQVDGLTQSNPWGVLAGMGEHGREAMNLVSPFYGAMYRGMQRMLTDLPLAPTKPIDSGIATFCLDCKKCAENCPYGALPTGDPLWEHESPLEQDNVIDGHIYKGWRLYNYNCPRCQTCQGVCVFGKISESGVHELVRAVGATTSVFNGFFRSMDDAFGYGVKEPEEWWSSTDMHPVWGVDPRMWTKVR